MALRDKRIIFTGTAGGIGASALSALVAACARGAALDPVDDAGQTIAVDSGLMIR